MCGKHAGIQHQEGGQHSMAEATYQLCCQHQRCPSASLHSTLCIRYASSPLQHPFPLDTCTLRVSRHYGHIVFVYLARINNCRKQKHMRAHTHMHTHCMQADAGVRCPFCRQFVERYDLIADRWACVCPRPVCKHHACISTGVCCVCALPVYKHHACTSIQ